MEKSQANNKPARICEEIRKAVDGNSAFRAIHRISRRSRSQSPASANRLQTTDSDTPAKAQVFLGRLVALAPRQAGPAGVNIPIFHESESSSIMSNGKEKMAKSSVFVQKYGTVIISSPKIPPDSGQCFAVDKAKPGFQSQTTRPTTINVHIQGHNDELAPKKKLLLAELASRPGLLNKVTSKNEAKSPIVPMDEKVKPEQKAEIAAPSNTIVVENHGQRVYVGTKVEPPKPQTSMHEELPKPADHRPAPMTKITTPPVYDEVEEGKKGEESDGPEIFTNYINRVRDWIGRSSPL